MEETGIVIVTPRSNHAAASHVASTACLPLALQHFPKKVSAGARQGFVLLGQAGFQAMQSFSSVQPLHRFFARPILMTLGTLGWFNLLLQ